MNKIISLDSLQRLVIAPLKRLIDKKIDKVDGKGLSTNDYTNEEKDKLGNVSNVLDNENPNQVLVTDVDGNTVWVEKPFWSYMGEVEVLSLSTYNFTSASGTGYRVLAVTNIESNTEYIVLWDDEEYVVNSGDDRWIGNYGLTNASREDNGLPFYVSTSMIYSKTSGQHSIRVVANKMLYQTLDVNFLPSNVLLNKGTGTHAVAVGRSQATNTDSFAAGTSTASGVLAVALGNDCKASGQGSAAIGTGIEVSGSGSFGCGRYNLSDLSFLFCVGNGGYMRPSNAFTIDTNGDGWVAGDVYVGGTNKAEAIKLAKESDVMQSDWEQIDETAMDYIKNKPPELKDGIALLDQVNGYTYIACMRDGNLVTYCGIKSIAVTTMPTKVEYTAGDYFDPTGMVITGVAYDGVEKVIENYIIVNTFPTENEPFIKIIYKEAGISHTTTVPVTVNPFDAAAALIDFEYTANDDGTYTITGWKGTLNGEASTEMIIPNNGLIYIEIEEG